MKQRIWELDALRGLCILGVVIVHGLFDAVELYGLIDWDYPHWYTRVVTWGGLVFLVLSGICVTLGSRCVRRGCIVFLGGMACTLVTWGLYRLGFADKSIIIYFGVLHCLGVCMLLWPVFHKLPWWALAALGVALAVLGRHLDTIHPEHMWLMPLGLYPLSFASADYFPLVFHLGFFLVGAALGKTLYKNKTTLFPKVDPQAQPIRFFRGCGKASLWIYLLHQPVLAGVFTALSQIVRS